jgi:hypothetical protein
MQNKQTKQTNMIGNDNYKQNIRIAKQKYYNSNNSIKLLIIWVL